MPFLDRFRIWTESRIAKDFDLVVLEALREEEEKQARAEGREVDLDRLDRAWKLHLSGEVWPQKGEDA
jgi:hypothetical protein